MTDDERDSFVYTLKLIIHSLRLYRNGVTTKEEFFHWIDEMENGMQNTQEKPN